MRAGVLAMTTVRTDLLRDPLDNDTRASLEALDLVDFIVLKDVLPPGYTGSKIFLADISDSTGQNLGAHIIKVGRRLEAEVERHSAARGTAIGFRVPDIAFVGTRRGRTTTIVYRIAGASLVHGRPLAMLMKHDVSEARDAVSSLVQLLATWNDHGKTAYRTPGDFVTAVVGQMLPGRRGINQRMRDICGVDVLESPLVLFRGDNSALPNPVFFANHQEMCESLRAITYPVGFVHGDLHGGNIICVQGRHAQPPYLIDFASFAEDAATFLDLAYLELALLLQEIDFSVNAHKQDWLGLCKQLSETSRPGAETTHRCGLVGSALLELVAPIREQVTVQATSANEPDDYMTAFLLCCVTAGLNLFRKVRQDETAIACLAYSAHHLSAVLNRFSFSPPTTDSIPTIPWLEERLIARDLRKQRAMEELRLKVGAMLHSARLVLCLGPTVLSDLGLVNEDAVANRVRGTEGRSFDCFHDWDTALKQADLDASALKLAVCESMPSSLPRKTIEQLEPLSRARWAAVYDYGLSPGCARAVGATGSRTVLPILDRDEVWRIEIGPQLPLPWIFHRGNVLNAESLMLGAREWRLPSSMARRAAFYGRVAERLAPPGAVVFVGFPPSLLSRAYDEVVGAFADELPALVLVGDSDVLTSAQIGADVDSYPLSFTDLLVFLEGALPKAAPAKEPDERYVLDVATIEGDLRPVAIPPSAYDVMSESFELLHRHIASEDTAVARVPGDFYRGYPISWKELALGYDVQRSMYSQCAKAIKESLDDGSLRRLVITGGPGSGLSTLVARLGWDAYFVNHHPVVFVRRAGPALIDSIERLHDIMRIAFLIVAEDEHIDADELDRLVEQLRTKNLPAVVLAVRRVLTPRASSTGSALELSSELNPRELGDLRAKLRPFLTTEANTRLEGTEDPELFLNLLVAFEQEFVRLDRYVGECLEQADEVDRDLLQLVAFAGRYGPGPAVPIILSRVSGLPDEEVQRRLRRFERRLILEDHVDVGQVWRHILEDHVDVGQVWRLRHDLIGEAMLRHLWG
jgi:hypothetical protein